MEQIESAGALGFTAGQMSELGGRPLWQRPGIGGKLVVQMEQTFRSYIDPLLDKRQVDAVTVRDIDRLALLTRSG